jgi:hypothetical protein
MQYAKPQIVVLSDAVAGILRHPYAKGEGGNDGQGSDQITVSAYAADE